MSRHEKDHQIPEWQWQQALIDAYYDYRWRQLLEPLCETFQHWKAGELTHVPVDRAIEEAYKEKCWINALFSQRQDRAVALIQSLDREWFETWVKEQHPPSGVR